LLIRCRQRIVFFRDRLGLIGMPRNRIGFLQTLAGSLIAATELTVTLAKTAPLQHWGSRRHESDFT
jgi:hypothetical protein